MSLLEVKGLNAHYGSIHALKGIDLCVEENEIVTLIGGNGAGKTTTLSVITGLVHASAGEIIFNGENITNKAPADIVKRGICISPEGREVFPGFSVQENLKIGAFTCKDKEKIKENTEWVYHLFPRLEERKNQTAGTLSGGEQQMLAIGRALMANPKLLLLDEPSMGLAPNLVDMIFDLIQTINQQNVTILLIEQNANMALQIADRGYVIETGNITLADDAHKLLNDSRVKEAYLGM